MSELDTLKDAIQKARHAREVHGSQLVKMQVEEDRLQNEEIAALQTALAEAEGRKKKALRQFALGELAHDDLEAFRDATDECEERLRNEQELLGVLVRSLQEEQAKTALFDKALEQAKRAFWAALFEQKRQKLKSRVADELKELVVLGFMHSAGDVLSIDFLGSLMGGFPTKPEKLSLKAELEQKYLG